jgi:uncharacterized YccA/Bax inhibitor family protein
VLANPVLNDRTLARQLGRPLPPAPAPDRPSRGRSRPPGGGLPPEPISPWPPPPAPGAMAVAGTIRATAVLVGLTFVGGAFGWSQVETTREVVQTATGLAVVTSSEVPGWLWFGVIGALAAAIAIAVKPTLARVLGPVYALAYGAALGGISAVYEQQWAGIVPLAMLATASVFVVMLVLFATGTIRVTERLRMAIVGAMGGIFLLYLVSFVLSLFGVDLYFWRNPTPLGIGISVLIVGVAAFSLLLDFDFIQRAVAAGAPKHFEWYAAFGLTVTIVWLYLELLRLLSLLQGRD